MLVTLQDFNVAANELCKSIFNVPGNNEQSEKILFQLTPHMAKQNLTFYYFWGMLGIRMVKLLQTTEWTKPEIY